MPGCLKLHTSNELACLCSLTFKINRKHIGELLCFHTKVQNFFCSELLSVFFAAMQGRMIKVMDQIEGTCDHCDQLDQVNSANLLFEGLASHCKAETIGREVFLSANEKARHI